VISASSFTRKSTRSADSAFEESCEGLWLGVLFISSFSLQTSSEALVLNHQGVAFAQPDIVKMASGQSLL
jgi:hypothetical protein